MPKKETFTSRFGETRGGRVPKNLKFGETSFRDGPRCTSRNTVGLFRFSVPQFNRWQFKMMDFQTTGLNLSAKFPCTTM